MGDGKPSTKIRDKSKHTLAHTVKRTHRQRDEGTNIRQELTLSLSLSLSTVRRKSVELRSTLIDFRRIITGPLQVNYLKRPLNVHQRATRQRVDAPSAAETLIIYRPIVQSGSLTSIDISCTDVCTVQGTCWVVLRACVCVCVCLSVCLHLCASRLLKHICLGHVYNIHDGSHNAAAATAASAAERCAL